MIKKAICLMMVFLGGMITGTNLFLLQHGIEDTHYETGWWKVGLAIFLAIFFGYLAIAEEQEDLADYLK